MKSLIGASLVALVAGSAAHAASVSVYVGYADGVRPGADYPNPFAAGGTYFDGSNTYTISNFVANLSGTPDTGTIMLLNTGNTAVTVTNLDVNDHFNNSDYQIWTGGGAGQLGAGITLAPGHGAIFAENNGNNFDSSDSSGSPAFTGASQTGTTFDPNTNNCSTGAIAASVACSTGYNAVTFTLNGAAATFNDTAHVLDTGGYDSAGYEHDHTGGNGMVVQDTNESLQWRPIGTSGINNPGGGGASVPEPAALGALGLALAGLATVRRRA